MSENVTHQMMMLRPMQAGLSGYARLQGEPGRQLIQINLRGMQSGEMRVFWYAGEGLVREVGRSLANPRGEATLSAEVPADAAAPRRLMALLITDGGDRPRPMAIGLCTAQSAGSLMDAKNALLALCDKLSRMDKQKAAATAKHAASADTAVNAERQSRDCQTNRQTKQTETSAAGGIPARQTEVADSESPSEKILTPKTVIPPPTNKQEKHAGIHSSAILPREVFLPAIEAKSRPERRRFHRKEAECQQPGDSAGVIMSPVTDQPATSSQPPCAASGSLHVVTTRSIPDSPAVPKREQLPAAKPVHQPIRLPADRLPTLQWPVPFQSLAIYFEQNLPFRLMNWPGWRFVSIPESRLWIGYRQQDGRVRQVAYALPADAPTPEGQPFRPARAVSGEEIQLLVLDA